MEGVDVYPVGVLNAILVTWRVLTKPGNGGRPWFLARREWRRELRYLRLMLKHRNWRAIRNTFNGFLAEHEGCSHNCGRGWTQRAALRRADNICKKESW